MSKQAPPWHGAAPRLACRHAGRGRAGRARMMTSPVPFLDVAGFDRTAALSQSERDALTSLGWQLRRRRSHDAELPEWKVIGRLLAPLDAARSTLCDLPDTPLHRRSAKDAVGLVLHRCAE